MFSVRKTAYYGIICLFVPFMIISNKIFHIRQALYKNTVYNRHLLKTGYKHFSGAGIHIPQDPQSFFPVREGKNSGLHRIYQEYSKFLG